MKITIDGKEIEAKMGDENIGGQGSLQHGLALFCFYFFSVDCDFHFFTPVSGPDTKTRSVHLLVSVLKPIQLRRRVFACNASAVQAEAHGIARKDKWIAVPENIACVRPNAVQSRNHLCLLGHGLRPVVNLDAAQGGKGDSGIVLRWDGRMII